jgi:hypothetical protein
MGSNLIHQNASSQVMYSRATRQALSIVQQNAVVKAAQIEAEAELSALRFQAIGFMATVAMNEAAVLSQVEQQLAQLVPMAASRLQALGDAATLAMIQTLGDSSRRLG